MKKIKTVTLLFLLIITTSVNAQLKRANKYYDRYDYAKAVPIYKRILKNQEDMEVLEKIANSYRLLRNYQEAEEYYARLVTLPEIKPINYFYFGEVLKNNNKADAAKFQYVRYLQMVPGDTQVEDALKSCDEIKVWVKRTQQFDVAPLENLNTSHSEFSPSLYKDKLIFTSDRAPDLVNNSSDSWNKQPFLNEYYVDITGKKDSNLTFSKNPKLLPWPINTDFHDGPMCFDEKTNTMYITRVGYEARKKDPNFVNRPQLYSAEIIGTKWQDAKPFKYNDEKYSVAHPSVSNDGQWLYFSSDMPGGMGGLDIYRCHKEETGWGESQNLGDKVNTVYDEVFPFIRKDGTLFFSSSRHLGFGGLDIFSATKEKDKFTDVSNLGSPLNSPTDDFGIVFTDDIDRGYFSSDRNSGKGSDDIYTFIALHKFITIDGKILLSQNINNPAKHLFVKLFTEEGTLVSTTYTDTTGYFNFEHLPSDKQYLVKIDETDPQLIDRDKVYMANNNDKIVRVIVINDKGDKFVFHRLPLDPNELELMMVNDDDTFAGSLLYGNDPNRPMANKTVNLVNDNGDIVGTTTTDGRGAFVFHHLPADRNFLVKVDETDANLDDKTLLSLTDKNGKEIQSAKAGNRGDFKFSLLPPDKNTLTQVPEEDAQLKFNFRGKLSKENKTPLRNTTINLVDEDGNILGTVVTNENGYFMFMNLPSDKNLLFTIDETDSQIDFGDVLYLTDEKGNLIKVFRRNKKGKFEFFVLPTDVAKLDKIYADDTQLSVNLPKPIAKETNYRIENLYYDFNEFLVLPTCIKTLYKISELMQSNLELNITFASYTDERGSADYNLKLSNKRAVAAKDFLIVEGIDAKRITAQGYGETNLLNKCGDKGDCTDEQHSVNRRTEVKINK